MRCPAGARPRNGGGNSRGERLTSQIVYRGGPNKEARGNRAVRDYLAVGRELSAKVHASLLDLCDQPVDAAHWEALAYFQRMLAKHLDLVERRPLRPEEHTLE